MYDDPSYTRRGEPTPLPQTFNFLHNLFDVHVCFEIEALAKPTLIIARWE